MSQNALWNVVIVSASRFVLFFFWKINFQLFWQFTTLSDSKALYHHSLHRYFVKKPPINNVKVNPNTRSEILVEIYTSWGQRETSLVLKNHDIFNMQWVVFNYSSHFILVQYALATVQKFNSELKLPSCLQGSGIAFEFVTYWIKECWSPAPIALLNNYHLYIKNL